MSTKPTAQATSRVREVSLPKEIERLAAKDGIPLNEIDVEVAVTRRAYYEAVIRSYYSGFDAGFADAIGELARPVAMLVRIKVAVVRVVSYWWVKYPALIAVSSFVTSYLNHALAR